MGVPINPMSEMESLASDFTKSALERSKEMSQEEFDRTVRESHEIIDRRLSPSRLTADS
jgi:hypothetical protein